MASNVPSSRHLENRAYTDCQGPYTSGSSLHCAPLRAIQSIPLSIFRPSFRGRPRFPVLSGGSTATYRIVGAVVYPDSHFIGREAELGAIKNQLEGTENKLFLMGMGGIGKSEVVRMYLKRHAQDYDVMLWVSFEHRLCCTLASDTAVPIQGLSQADFPEDSDWDYFQRKLRILKEMADRRVLLAVDNFDVPDDPDLESFTSGEYAVIFTTRCHQDSGCLPEIDIWPVVDRGEQMKMLWLM